MVIEVAGRSSFFTASGLRHHVLSYGATHEPAVVILPGITSPAATADFLARRIADLGFSVHVPDFRGRGASDVAPSGHYRLEDYAGDVAGLIAEFGLEWPILLGHSMGARIAAAYVTRFAPKDHALAVLVDPPLSGPGRAPYPTNLASFMAQLSEAKSGTSVDAVRKFYPKWPERELQLRIEVLPSCDETAIRETHAGFEAEDFFPIWKELTLPAALIYGGRSPVVSASGLADLVEINPAVPTHCVPEAGHMIPWDNEAGFFEVIIPMLLAAKDARPVAASPMQ